MGRHILAPCQFEDDLCDAGRVAHLVAGVGPDPRKRRAHTVGIIRQHRVGGAVARGLRPVRAHPARFERRDLDAEMGDFGPQHFGKPAYRPFRSLIGRNAGGAHAAADG